MKGMGVSLLLAVVIAIAVIGLGLVFFSVFFSSGETVGSQIAQSLKDVFGFI